MHNQLLLFPLSEIDDVLWFLWLVFLALFLLISDVSLSRRDNWIGTFCQKMLMGLHNHMPCIKFSVKTSVHEAHFKHFLLSIEYYVYCIRCRLIVLVMKKVFLKSQHWEFRNLSQHPSERSRSRAISRLVSSKLTDLILELIQTWPS